MGKSFKLVNPIENSIIHVKLNASLGGGVIALNLGLSRIKAPKAPNDKLKPATQADLRTVYDNGPSYASIITPPDGYRAPWQDDLTSEEE